MLAIANTFRAGISTIIRTPYIRYYRTPTDNLVCMYHQLQYGKSLLTTNALDHVGNIVLWSNIETTIGLVAGSIPTLRRLFMRSTDKTTGYSGSGMPAVGTGGNELRTIGGGGRRTKNRSFKNPTDPGVSVATVHARKDNDWRRLGDYSQSDQEHQIRKDRSYKVEMEISHESKSSLGGSSRESIIKRER